MDWSIGTFGDLHLDKEGCDPSGQARGQALEEMVLRKTVCLRRLGGNRGGELQSGRFFAHAKEAGLTGPALAGPRPGSGWFARRA
jgi:hypothetical protein